MEDDQMGRLTTVFVPPCWEFSVEIGHKEPSERYTRPDEGPVVWCYLINCFLARVTEDLPKY